MARVRLSQNIYIIFLWFTQIEGEKTSCENINTVRMRIAMQVKKGCNPNIQKKDPH